LRLLIAIPFILIGAILTATTIEDISYLGNITIKILGFGIIAVAASFIRNKQGQTHDLNNNRYKWSIKKECLVCIEILYKKYRMK
jgi:hypothetical protein